MNCRRQWSTKVRQPYHVLSTTHNPTTSSQPSTTFDDVIVTVQQPMDENSHVTFSVDGDWSRQRTIERPPPDNIDDDLKTLRKKKTESLKTVKHWVKYGPSVYRELTEDLDDEDLEEDKITIRQQHHHHHHEDDADRPVVHVDHVHEDRVDGTLVVDIEAGRRSLTQTIAVDRDDLASSVSEQTSSSNEQLQTNNNNELSDTRDAFIYNIEEGLTADYIS